MSYEEASILLRTAVLVVFVLIFVAIVIYAYWPGNKKSFDEAAQLPLDDDDKPEGDRK
jgi:cytochrome c oxidase cbb3-type subunit 4